MAADGVKIVLTPIPGTITLVLHLVLLMAMLGALVTCGVMQVQRPMFLQRLILLRLWWQRWRQRWTHGVITVWGQMMEWTHPHRQLQWPHLQQRRPLPQLQRPHVQEPMMSCNGQHLQHDGMIP